MSWKGNRQVLTKQRVKDITTRMTIASIERRKMREEIFKAYLFQDGQAIICDLTTRNQLQDLESDIFEIYIAFEVIWGIKLMQGVKRGNSIILPRGLTEKWFLKQVDKIQTVSYNLEINLDNLDNKPEELKIFKKKPRLRTFEELTHQILDFKKLTDRQKVMRA